MRACIFCGGVANSREDVWPQWMLKLLDRRKSSRLLFETPSGLREIKGKNAALKTKKVCAKRCNNGWMSDLEEDCKPLMEALIKGDHTVNLASAARFRVALWTLKTCMVLDSILPKGQTYFSQSDRERLLPNPSGLLGTTPMPDLFRVWIGAYRGSEPIYGETYICNGVGTTVKTREKFPIRGHAFTLSIGQLVIQALSATVPPEKAGVPALFQPNDTRWDRHVRLVWPLSGSSVSWPPSQMLDDSGLSLNGFANRWRGTSDKPLQGTPPAGTESES